jgi:hypothetical protein
VPGALLIAALLAQSAAPMSADTAQLDRVRQALTEQPAIVTKGAFDKPVFRVTVEGWKFNGPPWEERASFVRPGMPMYHYDYLLMTTPEAFRASTLYPGAMGLPIGALIEALGKKIGEARRRRAEASARAEVTAALQELLACREDPSRPGC